MYVYYWADIIYCKDCRLEALDRNLRENESRWMVPGTVDPRDD